MGVSAHQHEQAKRQMEPSRRSHAAVADRVPLARLASAVGNRAFALAVQRTRAHGGPSGVLQRTISYNAQANQLYQQSHDGLLKELVSEFSHVDPKVIDNLIVEIEGRNQKWSPYQAYLGIRKFLRQHHPPKSESVSLDGTNITKQQAEWYFVSNFKTFAEVIVDGKVRLEFVNTPDDNHAEDNMMAALDKYIEKQGWHEDFSGTHTLLMRINNSPCKRCARRLYDWGYRDIFVEFRVIFANMYEKDTGFTNATTRLRSGGVAMSLMSVTKDLLPLIDKEEKIDARARGEKDLTEQMDWSKWQKQHSASNSSKDDGNQ
jgi:hypothetical protein